MKTFQFLVAMAVIVAIGGVADPAFAGMKSGRRPAAPAMSRTTEPTEKAAEKVTEKAPRKAAVSTVKKEKQGKKASKEDTRLESGKNAGGRKKTA